jgi:lysozyme family protein
MKNITFLFCIFSTIAKGASFSLFFPEIIKHEGVKFTAYQWDADGGGTKFGITLNTLKYLSKAKKLDFQSDKNGDHKITAFDLQHITIAEVESIYKSQYWNQWRLDYVNSQLVAEAISDHTIMAGYGYKGKHIKGIHKICNRSPPKPVIDSETVVYINSVEEQKFLHDFSHYRWNHLQHCKAFRYAKRGWLTRVNSFLIKHNENQKMVGGRFLSLISDSRVSYRKRNQSNPRHKRIGKGYRNRYPKYKKSRHPKRKHGLAKEGFSKGS